MKTRYAKTMRDAIAEVWANDITLDEGRMKTIATMFDAGKTPEEIAKKMKLPVATVKSILGEEDLPEEIDRTLLDIDKELQALKKDETPREVLVEEFGNLELKELETEEPMEEAVVEEAPKGFMARGT